MASMKRVLDGLLKKYNQGQTIPMSTLAAVGAMHYGATMRTYNKDYAMAMRMSRRCYRITPGFAGGVVNPFYRKPKPKKIKKTKKVKTILIWDSTGVHWF